ncbi:methylamine dehydrogenase (amicyanin) small subunit [Acetobacter tropicalis]|uniref:Methylamine dehydrogenase light chain n=1 Tax=Acetobacter senegalensis TaxID=446692 RepID=A0A0U5EVY4_9PROT|nr:methylamine dehydrogenase (amicyanin) small subunit [Acetobacter senegalensis]KXV57191.1 methylamine dehydrogenase [Acetobacter senegalensis]MCG4254599.1 methylamine dehydrogenase (amicyanin) small subunit [Acetobacter senegalensis]MCG4257724.1 methylamine dehydrogenase (amicyanin) small subunit [Acetobacter senegalensis]MCG4261994.1 methylamine dehydrogenase (amicyanin) small subunit [Acetobacter senegalensis]MCG4267790.1 methylamine dehydrogenase (amicyanin) small subunit [Acetobacter sen
MSQSDAFSRHKARSEKEDTGRSLLDRAVERLTRHVASRSSRRSLLGRAGAWVTFGALVPTLPVERASAATPAKPQPAKFKAPTPFAANAQTKDPTACNYWRYCAIDGFLCASCGGGVHSCPPGTSPSPTSWIGTCFNPGDGQSYLVAYRDCCGQDACSQPMCLGSEGDQPSYRPQANNDIIWCFGTGALIYNCSTSVIVGNAS